MSSTGNISKVVGAPANSFQQVNKQQSQEAMAFPGMQDGLRQVSGRITSVHESKPLIKVHTLDGHPVANGRWIPLNHSRLQISELFGQLRNGLLAQVFYSGPSGDGANASIIGNEKDFEGEGTQVPNDIDEPAYLIIPPGSTSI